MSARAGVGGWPSIPRYVASIAPTAASLINPPWSQSRPVESESEHLLGGIPNPGLLEVRAADLEFDPSSFTSNVAADLPLRPLLPPTPEEFSQHHAAAWPPYTQPSNSRVYQDSQLQNPSPAVGEFTWGQKALMYIGDYDSPKCGSELAKGMMEELAKGMTEFDCTKSSSVVDPRKGGEDASWKKYQDEIFVTIKDIGTNNMVFLLSNKSQRSGMQLSQALFVPPAWLDRIEAERYTKREALHLRKITLSMAALEGTCGWLLLANPPPLNKPKIEVFGVGKNGMKHKIERGCIKPRRKDDAGKNCGKSPHRSSSLAQIFTIIRLRKADTR
ncbi:hypothetical protein B0H14DRAFT_2583770 [Mycena olivaceomarginata]|nr:hypothetical protein B0H14DRAFT_2583770 [Mycena olivaceomarginata]